MLEQHFPDPDDVDSFSTESVYIDSATQRYTLPQNSAHTPPSPSEPGNLPCVCVSSRRVGARATPRDDEPETQPALLRADPDQRVPPLLPGHRPPVHRHQLSSWLRYLAHRVTAVCRDSPAWPRAREPLRAMMPFVSSRAWPPCKTRSSSTLACASPPRVRGPHAHLTTKLVGLSRSPRRSLDDRRSRRGRGRVLPHRKLRVPRLSDKDDELRVRENHSHI